MRILRMAAALKHRGVDTVVAIPLGTGAFGDLLEEAGVPYHRVPGMRRPRATANPLSHLGWLAHLWGSIRRLVRLIRDEGIAVVHQNDVTHVQGAIAGRLAGCGGRVAHQRDALSPGLAELQAPGLPGPPRGGRVLPGDGPGVHGLAGRRVPQAGGGPVPAHRRPRPGQGRDPRPRTRRAGHPRGLADGRHRRQPVPNQGPPVFSCGPPPRSRSGFPGPGSPSWGRLFRGARSTPATFTARSRRWVSRTRWCSRGFAPTLPTSSTPLTSWCSPSLSESFGMSIAEGLAAGLPVVASNVGGVPEIIQDGETGILVQPRDPEAIASGVASLLEDREHAASMAARGRDRIREMFSPDRCAGRARKSVPPSAGSKDLAKGDTLEPAGAPRMNRAEL